MCYVLHSTELSKRAFSSQNIINGSTQNITLKYQLNQIIIANKKKRGSSTFRCKDLHRDLLYMQRHLSAYFETTKLPYSPRIGRLGAATSSSGSPSPAATGLREEPGRGELLHTLSISSSRSTASSGSWRRKMQVNLSTVI